MLTIKLAKEIKMEVAEIHMDVVRPMSESLALVLFGVTYRMSFCCK